MEKSYNHLMFKYLLISCLSITLFLAQSNRFHMHALHDGHSSAVEVSAEQLLKKTNLLNPLVFFLLFAGLFLCIPRLANAPAKKRYKSLFIPFYSFHQPPLRAPPTK